MLAFPGRRSAAYIGRGSMDMCARAAAAAAPNPSLVAGLSSGSKNVQCSGIYMCMCGVHCMHWCQCCLQGFSHHHRRYRPKDYYKRFRNRQRSSAPKACMAVQKKWSAVRCFEFHCAHSKGRQGPEDWRPRVTTPKIGSRQRKNAMQGAGAWACNHKGSPSSYACVRQDSTPKP